MQNLAALLLNWYDQHARALPWRNHPDPYAVWVSEIMLQQTRVETVIPYFEKWMLAFPTVQALAAAPEQQVLSLWEGLGYYSRARNLHKGAQVVVTQLNGQIPASPTELQLLPGIGAYTAAAIASMAFNQNVATVDGNIKRVYSRLFNVEEIVESVTGTKLIWALAKEHLPPARAGDYNQALMDLGATVCLPKNPSCGQCPLESICKAKALGVQSQRPILKVKTAIPHKLKSAAVLFQDDKVLLIKRPANGLLGGLWEFPSVEVEADSAESLVAAIEAEYKLVVSPLNFLLKVQHTYTHFKLTEYAYLCQLNSALMNEAAEWVDFQKLTNYPMGKVDRRIANFILSSL